MNAYQEPKYKIEARLVNRQSGEPIPDDEPLFVLRARDVYAVDTILAYLEKLPGGTSIEREHRKAVRIRLEQFTNWRAEHQDRMKHPDSNMDGNWTGAGRPSV